MNRSKKLLWIGFGGVGRELARILTSRDFHAKCPEKLFTVTGIATASSGVLYEKSGLDLGRALTEKETLGEFSPDNPSRRPWDTDRLITESEYDILVEMSPLSIEQCGQPALRYMEAALKTGRSCVSANKGPLAFAYCRLAQLASSGNAEIRFESTVMDGAPVFNLVRYGMRGCRVLQVEGILNATSNFVLSRMERGESMPEAIRQAQLAGFAEADPSHDIEGWDAAAKISVLSNVLLGSEITPLEIPRDGIHEVTIEQARKAVQNGKRLKLVARASRTADGSRGDFKTRGDAEVVEAAVELKELPLEDPFARVPDQGSILRIYTDLMGPLTIQQEAPTLSDTAYGVLNDLLEIA